MEFLPDDYLLKYLRNKIYEFYEKKKMVLPNFPLYNPLTKIESEKIVVAKCPLPTYGNNLVFILPSESSGNLKILYCKKVEI